jgi:hypothetical protein
MAIYRRSSRRPLVIVGVIAAVAGLVVGYLGGRATAPDLGSQIRAARAQVAPIVTSLEVIRTEYPKLLNATAGSDPGGAESALARARSTFTAQSVTWSLIDPTGTTALGTALDALAAKITQRAPDADVDAAIDTAAAAANRIASTAPGA